MTRTAPEPDDLDESQRDTLWKLTKDLKKAAKTLSADEARYLVDRYYQLQNDRIRADAQVRAAGEAGEPNALLGWMSDTSWAMESAIKKALDIYSDQHAPGRWAKAQYGIGPVLCAGLLAHIDITKAPTVGKIWRFAGLDPTVEWKKNTKRPWNARLKTLCWKIGDSFVKFHKREACVYGRLYAERKALEIERNLRGEHQETAKATLETRKFDKSTPTYAAYLDGKLPDGRIDLRARRWAVKLFLSGLHEAMYFDRYGTLPPKPYAIEHQGHAHYFAPPHMEEIPGWTEARAAAGPTG